MNKFLDTETAAGADGRIYVFGGRARGDTFSTVEAFDPATGFFTRRANMPTPRFELMAATYRDPRVRI